MFYKYFECDYRELEVKITLGKSWCQKIRECCGKIILDVSVEPSSQGAEILGAVKVESVWVISRSSQRLYLSVVTTAIDKQIFLEFVLSPTSFATADLVLKVLNELSKFCQLEIKFTFTRIRWKEFCVCCNKENNQNNCDKLL